jgi:hypothetical protein
LPQVPFDEGRFYLDMAMGKTTTARSIEERWRGPTGEAAVRIQKEELRLERIGRSMRDDAAFGRYKEVGEKDAAAAEEEEREIDEGGAAAEEEHEEEGDGDGAAVGESSSALVAALPPPESPATSPRPGPAPAGILSPSHLGVTFAASSERIRGAFGDMGRAVKSAIA